MPSEDKDRFYKLSSIVDDFTDDIDAPELWLKSLKWAIRGLEEIHLDVWTDIKTKLLTVTDRRTVVLPDDFVDWVKVGIPQGQYCVTLGVNDALRLDSRSANRTDTLRGLLSQNFPNGMNFSNYSGYYFFNSNGASIFSVGGGLPSKGFFKYSDNGTCKELLLDYDYKYSSVYVEYITNGFDPCGETVVNPYLKDYLLKYMSFKFEEFNNPKANETSILRKGRDLNFAVLTVRARGNNVTPKDMLNISRSGVRLTAKV